MIVVVVVVVIDSSSSSSSSIVAIVVVVGVFGFRHRLLVCQISTQGGLLGAQG